MTTEPVISRSESNTRLLHILLSMAIAALVTGCGDDRSSQASAEIRIAAAASLSHVFEEMKLDFERVHGQKVALVFGSSGLIAKQLTQGAMYDAFYSASPDFIEIPVKAGVCDRSTVHAYALGRLVVWTRDAGKAPRTLTELTDPRFTKIALITPDLGSYGRAARQALERTDLWSRLTPRIVLANTATHAQQYAQTGNVDVALIPESLAIAAKSGHFIVVDPSLYDPVEQTAVICQGGSNAEGARAFAAFVGSSQGRSILERHGFVIPEN